MAGGRRDDSRGADANAAAASRSRRALGDVSNKDSKESFKAERKSEAPVLRRSRRLSDHAVRAAEGNEEADAAAAPRTQPLRSGKSTVNPFVEPVPRGRATRKRTSTAPPNEDSKQPASKPRAKRSRATQREESGPQKDSRRGRSSSLSKQDDDDEPKVVPSVCKNPCRDLLPISEYKLSREPFCDKQYTQGISSYDDKDKDDPLLVPGYATDIYQRLYDKEEKTRPKPYMEKQPELNGMMRAILIDWLVEVHMKFRLLPETLYLCVNIIDRYLSEKRVVRNKLQLVGVTALLIACKYEEIYPPEVKDCVYITDRAYTRQDVLDMEAEVVKTLSFTLTVPTGHQFLQRFLYVSQSSALARNLASFYMERMLQEHTALQFKPSLLAAAAVCLAHSNPDRIDCEGLSDEDDHPKIPPALLDYTGFSMAEIKEAAELMTAKIGEVNVTGRSRTLVAVKRKYETVRYNQVSTNFQVPKVDHLDRP